MTRRFTFLAAFLTLLLSSQFAFAQNVGDYRSNPTAFNPITNLFYGDWSNAAQWEVCTSVSPVTWTTASTVPSAANGVITIQTGDSMRLGSTVAGGIDEVVVATGGSLVIFANNTLQNSPSGQAIKVDGRLHMSLINNSLTGAGTILISPTGYFELRNSFVLEVTTINNGTTNFNSTSILHSQLTNNGTITLAGNLDINHADGNLINSATGIINITGNYYIGNAGIGAFSNSGTINKTATGTSAINSPFNNSGRIQGVGTLNIVNLLSQTGTIAPGNSPGILTTQGGVITSGSNLEIEIVNSTTPGTGHDRLTFTSSTTALAGTLTIIDNPAAPLGVYTIVNTTGSPRTITGAFTTVNKPINFGNPVYANNEVTIEKISVTLPVVWGGLNAIAKGNQVNISWTTLQEVNTAHFVVEHSTDGAKFTAIGNLQAKGNSDILSSYSFVHTSPKLTANNQYRIRQLDLDGKSTYSIVSTVSFDNGKVKPYQVGANPFRNTLQLTIQAEDVRVLVTGMNGHQYVDVRLQQGLHNIDAQKLPAGVYQLNIYQKGERIGSQKVVKL